MRNDGNTADGLVVRMSSSYFTDMSFIPPSNAIVEDGSTNIRSFEVVNMKRVLTSHSVHGRRFLMTKTQRMNST